MNRHHDPQADPTSTASARAGATIPSRWDRNLAATLDGPSLLRYRSNLLGADKRITNFGGGNTSSKIVVPDPLSGAPVPVLWVKGSGGDIGTIKMDGFATLAMDKLLGLQRLYRGPEFEDEMVALYGHCIHGLNPRAPSIDTPLHALVDKAHIDHMHPDAVIAIAAAADGQALTREIYGDAVGWLPWRRPGFELGVQLRRYVAEHPRARAVVLQAHGLVSWADTQQACYENTLDLINRAAAWLAGRATPAHPFGDVVRPAAPPARRAEMAAVLMPVLRGRVSAVAPKVGHFDDSATVLDFVTREQLVPLAAIGTSCPDHFLRTKICPLVLAFDPASETVHELLARLPPALDGYRAGYAAYYERRRRAGSPPMRDPSPVVCLVQGVGMLTFAADKATARIAAEFYTNAVNVMREASRVSTYCGLSEQEAFDIEYWQLEQEKLRRMPRPQLLSGRVALITGGAGGIGLATARRLLAEGAHVVLCDVDRPALEEAGAALRQETGADAVRTLWMDVTDEASVLQAYRDAALQYGGVDICVSNAGIASAAPVEDTTLALWNRSFEILSTGYFLVAREAFRCMRAQGLGGSIVFVGSKNALVASGGAAAYCTAKAAELHLARCLAVEGAPHCIRVNVVNPDAVLRGSRIWQGEWAEQRAEQYHTTVDGLEAVYRERSLLKENVYPEDVAEAVAFFASSRSGKSTGNILNVDAGNAAAFTR